MAQVDAVHPHVRGDNLADNRNTGHAGRFTPTCVGTMDTLEMAKLDGTVHPHVRGDNLIVPYCGEFPPSVHPHVRGDNSLIAC